MDNSSLKVKTNSLKPGFMINLEKPKAIKSHEKLYSGSTEDENFLNDY